MANRDEEYMHQLPWLNPECDHVVNRHLAHGFEEKASRASRTGLVNHRVGDSRDTALELIPVSDVVAAVLRNAGLKFIGRSSNGLAAERIVAQLGSIYGCSIFQHRGVRDVLHYLERGEKSLPAAEVMARLKKLNRPTPYQTPDMAALMDKLVQKHVLRPGLVFQCKSCGRYDWYHVSAFNERFKCKWCFTDQLCPRVETLKWHYRTDGLFALEGKMGGSISVLLAILHIKLQVHDTVHYYPSFEYKDGDHAHEIDFMCFVKDRSDEIEIVIGEAKSGNDLKDDEVARMEDVARRLNAWVVFCSLGSFSDADKEHFKRLRGAGIRLILLEGSQLEMFGDEYLGAAIATRLHRVRQRIANAEPNEHRSDHWPSSTTAVRPAPARAASLGSPANTNARPFAVTMRFTVRRRISVALQYGHDQQAGSAGPDDKPD